MNGWEEAERARQPGRSGWRGKGLDISIGVGFSVAHRAPRIPEHLVPRVDSGGDVGDHLWGVDLDYAAVN